MASLMVDIGANIARLQTDVAQAQKTMTGFATSTSNAFKAIAVGAAAWKIGDFIRDSAMLNARVETLGVVMNVVGRNARHTSQEMINFRDGVQAMGITSEEATRSVIRMTQAKLDLSKSDELARVAQDAATIATTDSSNALQRLIHGIVTLRPIVLRQLGIMISLEDEYKAWADATGKATTELSGAEKQTIAMNAVLREGEKISGAYAEAMETAGKKLTSLPRLMHEFQDALGAAFNPAFVVLIDEASAALKAFEHIAADEGTQDALMGLANSMAAVAEGAGEIMPGALKVGSGFLQGLASDATLLQGALEATGISLAAVAFAVEELGSFGVPDYAAIFEVFKDAGLRSAEAMHKAAQRVLKIYEDVGKSAKEAADEQRRVDDLVDKAFFSEGPSGPTAADLKRHQKLRKAQETEDKRYLKRWEKEKLSIGKSVSQTDMAILDRDFDNYNRVVTDKLALEQWFADQKREITLRANNEELALLEELFRATGEDEFAVLAIQAMEKILDAEERKWALILKDDDRAHTLRMQREEDYVDSILGGIDEIVDAEREGYRVRREMGDGFVEERSRDSDQFGGQFTTPSGFTIIERTGESVRRGWVEAAVAANKAADAATKTFKMQQESAQREAQRLQESRQREIQSSFGRFQAFIQQRSRSTWGMNDYQDELSRLNTGFAGTTSFDEQIRILNDMLDVLQSIDELEQQAIDDNLKLRESLKNQGQSISDWLASLQTGALNPAQGSGAFGARFEELRQAAMANPDATPQFLAFAREFLEFEKAFGTEGSYARTFEAVVEAVEDLGGFVSLMEMLSGMDLSSTKDDLLDVIEAFEQIGVSVKDLTEASAAAVAGDSGMASLVDLLKIQIPEAATIATGTAMLNLIDLLGIEIPAATTKAGGIQMLAFIDALGLDIPAAAAAAQGPALTSFLHTLGIDIPDAATTAQGVAMLSFLDTLGIEIPAAAATAQGAAMQALLTALESEMPEAMADAGGMEMSALISKLQNDIPAAATTAVGAAMIDLLDVLQHGIPEAATEAQGTAMVALIEALGVTLPTAAEAANSAPLLALIQSLGIDIPAAAQAGGSADMQALLQTIGVDLPAAIEAAKGTDMEAFINALANDLPEAARLATGAELTALLSILGVDLPGAAAQGAGTDLLGLLQSLGVDLPGSAQDANSLIDALIGNEGAQSGLLGTQDPFTNTIAAIATISAAFETLTAGLTGDAGLVGQISGALPSLQEYTQAVSDTVAVYWDFVRTTSSGNQYEHFNPNTGERVTTTRAAGSGAPAPVIYFRPRAAGGLADTLSVAGEIGPEWIIPTYEPQRSTFLNSAPEAFWKNIVPDAGRNQQQGSGDTVLYATFVMDREVVGNAVAKEGRTNDSYIRSVENIVGRMR